MVEPEVPLKKKDQVALDEEMARNLEAQLQAELIKEERLARQKEEEANIALIESWDNTQAMMEADFELAQRLQAEEQGEITIEEISRLFVELMNRRKKHFAKLRAEEIRRKPPTKAQKRNQMSTYLKNMAGYKHSQLKSKSYDEIQKLFDKEMKRVNTFVDMNSEVVKGSNSRTEESSKIAGDELESDMSKNTNPPVIVEYKIDKDGMMGYFKLIRADGSSKRYSSMIKMLQGIDREDLETWKLVKAKHENTRPEEDYKRVLWVIVKIQKMNIKFRGGLLGLKDFKMILRITTAQEFAMIDLGSLNYFLGISVARDSSGMFLSQKKYAVEILERAGMVNCNPSRTPVDTESKLGTIGDVVSDPTMYQSLASSLQYLTFTRPDNCHMLYFHNF
ncbi:putative ribonuclease H-like domain-containing protein [Tanacetum coccineum]